MDRFRYAVVTYWYQRPGETDPYGSVPLAERVGYEVEPSGTR